MTTLALGVVPARMKDIGPIAPLLSQEEMYDELHL